VVFFVFGVFGLVFDGFGCGVGCLYVCVVVGWCCCVVL
jgi:hypothetical protein